MELTQENKELSEPRLADCIQGPVVGLGEDAADEAVRERQAAELVAVDEEAVQVEVARDDDAALQERHDAEVAPERRD
jgi:hypothetical protein